MKTKLNLLAAGMLLAASIAGFGQPTIQFARYLIRKGGSAALRPLVGE